MLERSTKSLVGSSFHGLTKAVELVLLQVRTNVCSTRLVKIVMRQPTTFVLESELDWQLHIHEGTLPQSRQAEKNRRFAVSRRDEDSASGPLPRIVRGWRVPHSGIVSRWRWFR